MTPNYYETRERLAQELANQSPDNIETILERVKALQEAKFAKVPFETLKHLALLKRKIEYTEYEAHCSFTGFLKFRLNYYWCQGGFETPTSMHLKIDDMKVGHLTTKPSKSKYVLEEDGTSAYLNIEEMKKVLDSVEIQGISGLEEFEQAFRALCIEHNLTPSELETRIDKVLELIEVDENWSERSEPAGGVE